MIRLLKKIILLLFISLIASSASGQDSRPITLEEYKLAKSFEVQDLDNDTYVKFENKYILDRYEMRKPVFITGDDGKRKRVDLYKLVAREDLVDLGVMVFYTTEEKRLYKVVIPNFEASGEVWEQYFEDIHAIDKEEENFVLKLSYVLSREFSFQHLKSVSGGDVADEHATYGTDICFPGDQLVTLEDGSPRLLKDIQPGDHVISVDPETRQSRVIRVSHLVEHEAENYAITELVLLNSKRLETNQAVELELDFRYLKATPNHPMLTSSGHKEMRDIEEGETVLTVSESGSEYQSYEVYATREITEGVQPVYSIEAEGGTPLLMNGVMVKQKY